MPDYAAITGLVTGGAAGGVGGFQAAKFAMRAGPIRDVVSVIGGTIGSKSSRLPGSEFVGRLTGQHYARTIVNQHFPTAPTFVKDYIVDGVGQELGGAAGKNPTMVLAAIGKHAKSLADIGVDGIKTRFPKVGEEAEGVVEAAHNFVKLADDPAVRSFNSTLGASSARGSVYLLGGVAGTGAGIYFLREPIESGINGAVNLAKDPFTTTQAEREEQTRAKEEAARQEELAVREAEAAARKAEADAAKQKKESPPNTNQEGETVPKDGVGTASDPKLKPSLDLAKVQALLEKDIDDLNAAFPARVVDLGISYEVFATAYRTLINAGMEPAEAAEEVVKRYRKDEED